ncbi:MAG: efflux RND transporter periplasmic adaptor subunit [Oligoflexus sp.]
MIDLSHRSLWMVIWLMLLGSCTPKPSSEHTHEHEQASPSTEQQSLTSSESDATIYSCPMHPQIRQPEPGRCPICGMELVPTLSQQAGSNRQGITIVEADRRLAGIRSMLVTPKHMQKKITAFGSITFDESRIAQISAHVDGRIDDLFADYTGMRVNKGDHLAVIYSPKLYEAQVEFLQIERSYRKQSPMMVENARSRLEERGMQNEQIERLLKRGQADSRITIYAPRSGTIIQKPVSAGQYFSEGERLFQIADLSTVWLILEAFPEDAALIHYGQEITAKVSSQPNERFRGRVAFIDPTVNTTTRTVQVRIEVPNPDGKLRPGDYAEAVIEVPITTEGRQAKIFDPELVGKWISPMHPQIIRDKPGACPICGMKLVPAEKFGFVSELPVAEEVLAIPRRAILKVGEHAIVFVEEAVGRFVKRQVQMGELIGDEVIIVDGLEEYESIAVDGVFLIDSQMQLSGDISLIDLSHGAKKQNHQDEEHQH